MKLRFLSSILLASYSSYTTADDIKDIIVSEGNGFSTLATALEEAKLAPTFDASYVCENWPNSWCPKYTVFAPTDDSFEGLPEGTLDRLLSVEFRPHLEDLLLYHVLKDVVVSSSDIDDDDNIKTMNGETISAVKSGDIITINGNSNVTQRDLEAVNGVVHGINNVLLPTSATKNIADVAIAAGFERLVELLVTVGLDTAVSDPTNILTVFAPTDAAFEKLDDDGFDFNDVVAVTNLLKYHVITDEVITEKELKQRDNVLTLQGGSISVDYTRKGWIYKTIELNGDDIISQTDILASNGVIHVIDTVLIPPKDIVAIAVDNTDLSTLVSAVVKADLSVTLQGAGPFTVFAPTNAAFTKSGIDLNTLTDEELKSILLYHVVNESITEKELKLRDNVLTLQGGSISVDYTGFLFWKKIELNGDDIISQTDILASNGIIHVIDTVLLPDLPSRSISYETSTSTAPTSSPRLRKV